MRALLTAVKELQLLRRDPVGLIVLFVMPVLLVLVLTLTQENIFRATGEVTARALLVNEDTGVLGEQLVGYLEDSGVVALSTAADGDGEDAVARARQAVYGGSYQFAIVIPEHFSQAIDAAAVEMARVMLRGEEIISPAAPEVVLYFDPAVRGVYRTAVSGALRQALLALSMTRQSAALMQVLTDEVNRQLQQQLAPYGFGDGARIELPAVLPGLADGQAATVKEESATPGDRGLIPTSVQQNVPAWTLFGMFFIVVPLAGTLVRERQEGTLLRLMTMPVGSGSLLLGKVLAYLLVCLLQFGLMLGVGRFVLPRLGAPLLEMGGSVAALLLVAVAAALAACGFGILVGVVVKSYDQAAIFGSVSVVIAAALGGVMVPVYVMPTAMQTLSLLSPLGWGLEAFLEVFVRGGGAAQVLPEIAALGGFFCGCLGTAVLVLAQRRGNGRI